MSLFGSPRPASCKNKRRFNSDADAQAALKKINPTKALGKPNRVYRCPHCGGWHLSSKLAK